MSESGPERSVVLDAIRAVGGGNVDRDSVRILSEVGLSVGAVQRAFTVPLSRVSTAKNVSTVVDEG